MKHEIVIIGGGPAGLAAAISARESGVEDVLIIEREPELGGILNQYCTLYCFPPVSMTANMLFPAFSLVSLLMGGAVAHLGERA